MEIESLMIVYSFYFFGIFLVIGILFGNLSVNLFVFFYLIKGLGCN
jgi:hypothetical protein